MVSKRLEKAIDALQHAQMNVACTVSQNEYELREVKRTLKSASGSEDAKYMAEAVADVLRSFDAWQEASREFSAALAEDAKSSPEDDAEEARRRT